MLRMRSRFAGPAVRLIVPALAVIFANLVASPEVAIAAGARARQPILDLEEALARAELVVVVRLVEMTEAKIVHGGKMEVITQQFKFEPVRTLKGIFARDALLLTGQDLGIYQYGDAADRLQRGQMLLLLLGRQGPGYFNCNTAETLDQSIPRLRDQADPLLASVEALIAVNQTRDRWSKVSKLLAALQKAQDRDAAPLLISLRRRAVFAAQTPESADAIARFLEGGAAEVREVAARTLAAVLSSDYLQQSALRDRGVASFVSALDAPGSDVALRVAALDGLAAAGSAAAKSEAARAWLRADRTSTTFAEHAARLRAVGQSGRTDQSAKVAAFLEQLPLDAPADVQIAAGRALATLDPRQASTPLANRLAAKSEAGLAIASEIALVGELPREIATPALLAAFPSAETHEARLAYAMACARVADPRLVPSLGTLLDPRHADVRWHATEALRLIDTDEAASVLWPHLAQESDLLRKLQLAGFLGKHGFRGGYPYAIEHMSSSQLQDAAVDALAAIREPKAVPELRKIWDSSNDAGWNSAAIRALGRLGQADNAPRLLEYAADRRNPLAAPALIALGDLAEVKALPVVLDAVGSRNDAIVIAAIRASRKLLAAPGARGDELRDRLAALVADPDASVAVRAAAVDSLVALSDPRLGAALSAAARDGTLENSELMGRIESLLEARKEKLGPAPKPVG